MEGGEIERVKKKGICCPVNGIFPLAGWDETKGSHRQDYTNEIGTCSSLFFIHTSDRVIYNKSTHFIMLPRQASINHSISLGECKLDKLHVRKNTECNSIRCTPVKRKKLTFTYRLPNECSSGQWTYHFQDMQCILKTMFVETNAAEKQHTLNFLAAMQLFAKIRYFERNKCGRSQDALFVTRNLLGPLMVAWFRTLLMFVLASQSGKSPRGIKQYLNLNQSQIEQFNSLKT